MGKSVDPSKFIATYVKPALIHLKQEAEDHGLDQLSKQLASVCANLEKDILSDQVGTTEQIE